MKEQGKANERSKVVMRAGFWFILTNFLLAGLNVFVGMLSGSIAIMSDAAHSLVDAISGLLIIVSEKIARKRDAYREKIERITTILIALIIIAMGVRILIESIEKFMGSEKPDYTVPTFVILIASIVMKLVLAMYLKQKGKLYKSTVLLASSAETLNDTWISVAVLLSAVIYLIWQVDIEAYISAVISLVIVKVGLEFIFPHISHHHHHALELNPDHDHCKKH